MGQCNSKRNLENDFNVAIINDDKYAIQNLIQKCHDLEFGQLLLQSAFRESIRLKKEAISILLLKEGKANIEIVSEFNENEVESVLTCACEFGNVAIIDTLLAEGANVNCNDKWGNGESCIVIAARGGFVDIVKKLLKSGKVDIDKRTTNNNTALLIACEKGRLDVVQVLLEAKANTIIVNMLGKSAMDMASSYPDAEIATKIKELLNHYTPKEKVDRSEADDEDWGIVNKVIHGLGSGVEWIGSLVSPTKADNTV